VAAAGAAPTLIDSNVADPHPFSAAPLVWITLTDARLIWSVVHLTPAGPHSYLRSYDLKTRETRNLADADAAHTEYWLPNVDDTGRLVFGTVEYGTGASPDQPAFHVYLAQVGAGPLVATRLDSGGNSTEPVLSGDTVIWKSVTRNNVVSGGQLSRYSLSSGLSSPLSFGDQPYENDPTAGSRFVAA